MGRFVKVLYHCSMDVKFDQNQIRGRKTASSDLRLNHTIHPDLMTTRRIDSKSSRKPFEIILFEAKTEQVYYFNVEVESGRSY